MVRNLLANAGDAELIPGWGTKISHAMGQLSPCTEITEPVHSGEMIKSTDTHTYTHHFPCGIVSPRVSITGELSDRGN